MATQRYSAYQWYKRNTNHLIYWVVNTSNTIIEHLNDRTSGLTINTTGQVTKSSLISLAELISLHINEVPPAVLHLFRSVIDARKAFHASFKALAQTYPGDRELEKSNEAHESFIETLTTAFHILSGSMSSQAAGDDVNPDTPESPLRGQDELNLLLLTNKFSMLGFEDPTAGDDEDGEASDAHLDKPGPSKGRQQPRSKKSKKPKRGKSKNQKPPKPAPTTEAKRIPIEGYRIVTEEEGLMDYLVVANMLAAEWTALRKTLQGFWREAAYGDLNTAVAGCLSNVAIQMVRRNECEVFVDFPGLDSYMEILTALTGGKPGQMSLERPLALLTEPASGTEAMKEVVFEHSEHVMVRTMEALCYFIRDFRKTRSGRPTKKMLKEIKNWDLKFDLQGAQKEERLQWRRVYIINWLYDLVNVYSSPITQGGRDEKVMLEEIDWSETGPCGQERRLFGLTSLAATITELAMQKGDDMTDVMRKILPHHILQLQCVIDSFAVSRGWFIDPYKGDRVGEPAQNFHPRRDVSRFMEQFPRGAGLLQDTLKVHEEWYGNLSQHQEEVKAATDRILCHFEDWLGKSMYINDPDNTLASRFTNSSANGLWEYSPFLCGVGLAEGMELAQLLGMYTWERFPEVTLMAHMHNMLAHRGYIKSPQHHVFAAVNGLFSGIFFNNNSQRPSAKFSEALMAKTGRTAWHIRQVVRPRQTTRTYAGPISDVRNVLLSDLDRFYRDSGITQERSALISYREAEWNPGRIADADVVPQSALGWIRLQQTARVLEKDTGRFRLEETELVKRLRANPEVRGLEDRMAQLPRFSETLTKAEARLYRNGPSGLPLTGGHMLKLLKADFVADICGDSHMSGFNYLSFTATVLNTLMNVESQLKKLQNPVWKHAYKPEFGGRMTFPRTLLLRRAIEGRDEQCMETMAEELESIPGPLIRYSYWDHVQPARPVLQDGWDQICGQKGEFGDEDEDIVS